MQNSLTVSLPLLDVDACRLEIERQRLALETGWAKVPGLVSACLVILPAATNTQGSLPALFLECCFETELAELLSAWFETIGAELSAVLRHCSGFPEPLDGRAFADYLSARARRGFAFGSRAAPSGELEIGSLFWRLLDALSSPGRAPNPTLSEEALETRRLAVGMQDPTAGVPLVHVTWLVPGAGARVKRALRELAREPAVVEHDARFLLDGTRLVFFAYPSESAARWTERLAETALAPCARIWRNTCGYPQFSTVRARRERRLQEFVLEQRVPVAAWFNARARPDTALSARRES